MGLIHGLLNSRTMRDGYPTVAKMFRIMELEEKICLRIIDKIEHNTFTLLDRYFGDIRKKSIYLAHVPWHLFFGENVGLVNYLHSKYMYSFYDVIFNDTCEYSKKHFI